MCNSLSSSTLWDRVRSILAKSEFRDHARGFDRRPLIRIANSLGGPPMRLLHWKKLVDLERIPHSDESEAVDAISGIDDFGAPDVEVFMVSHRWLRPSIDRAQAHPDGVGNEKAKTINEFSFWRRKWVLNRHGFSPEIYYWIDYSCMDQSNSEGAVPLLPLWIACCERFLSIETEDSSERTWCRTESLLSYVFSFADHHVSIGLDFRFKWPYTGIRRAGGSAILGIQRNAGKEPTNPART